MTVRSILETKGRAVFVISPDDTLAQAVKTLAEKKVGAVVVTDGNGHIKGILSERDVVRAIAGDSAKALAASVGAFMTAKVQTCSELNTINQVMEIMTRGRFRHIPVEENGKLVGIISIGDVVKKKIEAVEKEAEEIRSYIATA